MGLPFFLRVLRVLRGYKAVSLLSVRYGVHCARKIEIFLSDATGIVCTQSADDLRITNVDIGVMICCLGRFSDTPNEGNALGKGLELVRLDDSRTTPRPPISDPSSRWIAMSDRGSVTRRK